MLKDLLKKSLAIGLGFAVTSKEQVEKLVDELVKKGELSKEEAKQYLEELLRKGTETQEQLEKKLNEKANQLLNRSNLVTKEELFRLEKRIQELEQRLEELTNKNE